MGSSLYEFMSTTPFSAVYQSSKSTAHHQSNVLQLSHSLTIGEALHALSLYNVLSAPVVIHASLEDLDANDANSIQTQALVGWVSIGDICRGLASEPFHSQGSMLCIMSDLEKNGNKFFDRQIITLADEGDKELMFVSEASEASLLASSLMLSGKKGRVRHRIGIFDGHGEVVQVVSQSDIISFLFKNESLYTSTARKTLAELGLAAMDRNLFTRARHTHH